ncbi:MAG: hypothetical protein ACM3MH_06680 [Actinomycetota bacterium]
MLRHVRLPLLPLLLFVVTPALALPAPMSDTDLLTKSDLVALVRVISVTCTGTMHNDFAKEDLLTYSANVELLEVIKGDEPKGTDVNITFHDLPKHIVGPWSVFYYPGEVVWTHLVKDGDAYTTTWWNGRGEVVHKAIITDLPTKPGESVAVPRVRTEYPVAN